MQVIGFNFDKIQAERKNPVKGKLEIGSNIDIKSIAEEKLELIKDKSSLKVDFEFTVDYKPDVANIVFNGNVMILLEKDQAKNILKKWKKKEMPVEFKVPLFNFILTKSNLKAMQLEEELNLPTHIPLPKLKAPSEQQGKPYAG